MEGYGSEHSYNSMAPADVVRLFDQLVDSIPDIVILLLDRELKVVLAAGGALKQAIPNGPYEGRWIGEFVDPDRYRVALPHYLAALGGEASAEEQVVRTGQSFFVRYIPIIDADGAEPRYVLVLSQDMTELEHAYNRLADQQSAFNIAFDSAPIGQALLHIDGRFMRVNDAFCTMMGYERGVLLSLGWRDILHPNDRQRTMLLSADVLEGHQTSVKLEVRFIGEGQRVIEVVLGISLVRSHDGEPVYYHSHIVDVSELHAVQADLEHLAGIDTLTGLPNRRSVESTMLSHCSKLDTALATGAVIVLDVDRFKYINDTFGHGVGDEALRSLSDTWRQRLRKEDFIGRTGGDEFLVLLHNASLSEASNVASDLVRPIAIAEGFHSATASAGVATFRTGDSGDEVIARADGALLEAKRSGKGQVRVAKGDPTPQK